MGVREVPGPPDPGGTGLEGIDGKGREGSAQSLKPRANALHTYPGSRKAGLSGTARVTVGSLGASQATGPSLSRGSLYKKRQGVIGRALDRGYREGPQPLFASSPWDLPDHPDLGNHGCQEHPRKRWRGEQ